jgi:hypothetical protein
MKAQIIKSSTGVIAKLENGIIFTASENEVLKTFKARVKEEATKSDDIDDVKFNSVNYKSYKESRLNDELDLADGIEAQAIEEELKRRSDFIEDMAEGLGASEDAKKGSVGDVVELNSDDLPSEQDQQEMQKDIDKYDALAGGVTTNLTESNFVEPVQEPKHECLKDAYQEAEKALVTLKASISEMVEEEKASIQQQYTKAKSDLELVKIDTETAIDDAERAYKSARRVVIVNNGGTNDVEKTEDELEADKKAIDTTKAVLDAAKVDRKEKIDAAKKNLTDVKEAVKEKVDAIKDAAKLDLQKAKELVDETKKAYEEIIEVQKEKAQDLILETELEIQSADDLIKSLKEQLEVQKEKKRVAKQHLRTAKSVLKMSPTKRSADPSITLEEAEAEKAKLEVHKGSHLFFTPAYSDDVIEGLIKALTIDKRVNLLYFRVEALEGGAVDDEGQRKIYHVRTSRVSEEAIVAQ